MIENKTDFQGFNITFNTGEDCNLACTYCYEVNKKKTKLDIYTAKKFIDLILADEDPILVKGSDKEWILQQGLILDFIGGDALMYPDLVDEILSYFIQKAISLNHRWAFRWRASISTNGTLFANKKVREFVEKWKNNLSLGVSIDGCPEIHDRNRIFLDGKGSMDNIKEWWWWYKSLYPEASTKATATKETIPYLYKSLVFMHEELALNYINQNFIFEDMNLNEKDLEELDSQMGLCVNYVLKHKDDLYWSMIDKRFASAVSYKESCALHPNESWCGSGAMPALAPSGKIYPCFRFLPHTQGSGIDMSVGDVWNGFTRKENFVCIREHTREKISPEKCKNCEVESACAWCIAGAYSEKGAPYRQTYICEIIKMQAKWAKIYWEKMKNV